MAYKFQVGAAVLSGSLIQEGDITADSSDVSAVEVSASAALQAGGDLTIAGASSLAGTLDVAGEVDLAASGVSTSIRGGLTVDEDALFSDDVVIDGSLSARGITVFEQSVTMQAHLTASTISGDVFAGDIRENVNLADNGETLDNGYNYFATLGQAKSVSLPLTPSVGDIVKIKAPADCSNSYTITISAQGSHTIDGVSSIILESPNAAIEVVYVATNLWKLF
jgi:uncharacterized protein with beta-barrel porin domain